MNLNSVMIRNYRSIKLLTLKFDQKCRILVGINESGKTNILQALNLLDPKVTTSRRDLREPGLHEPEISEAYVRFVFTLTNEEIAELTKYLKIKVLSISYIYSIIDIKGTEHTLESFARSRQGLYKADILTGVKSPSVWSLSEPKILGEWKRVAASCPPDYQVNVGFDSTNGETAILKNFILVDTSEISGIPTEYLEEPEVNDLNGLATIFLSTLVSTDLPKVLFWNYDETKLLPPKVNLDQFCANPDSCLPLKRMFELHGITQIKKQIDAAKAGSANALDNMLRRVAEETSQHFHATWREYDRIKFNLAIDGPDLIPRIEDESNRYELSQRSDGF